MKKKLYCILLSLAMVITMMPAMSMPAFAEESEIEIETVDTFAYNGVVYVSLYYKDLPFQASYSVNGNSLESGKIYTLSDMDVDTGIFSKDPFDNYFESATAATITLNLDDEDKATYVDATMTTEKGEYHYTFGTAPVTDVKYYAKNNWGGGDDWTWKEMTKSENNIYTLNGVIFGGTGININIKEEDADSSWFDTNRMLYEHENGEAYTVKPTVPAGTEVSFRLYAPSIDTYDTDWTLTMIYDVEVADEYFIHHGWANGDGYGNLTWEKMTVDPQDSNVFTHTGKWYGDGCAINTVENKDTANWFHADNQILYERQNGEEYTETPTIPCGTEVTFRLNAKEYTITVVYEATTVNKDWNAWEPFGTGEGTWTYNVLDTSSNPVKVFVHTAKGDSKLKQLKIEDWGKDLYSQDGIDLIVNWDENTGMVTIPEQDTKNSRFGSLCIMIQDYQSLYGTDSYPCTYDPSTGTFNFGVVYYVLGGVTGLDVPYETLTLSTYAITDFTAQDAHGSISFDMATAAANATVTVTVTPENGYELSGNPVVLSADGSPLSPAIMLTSIGNNKYTFQMPAHAVKIKAEFKKSTEPGPTPGPTPAEEKYNVTVEGDSSVKVEATIENEKAKVSEITKKDLEEFVENIESKTNVDSLELDFTETKQDVMGVEFTKATLENVQDVLESNQNNINNLVVKMSEGTVSLDARALEAVTEQANGDTIILVVDKTQDNQLTTAKQKTLKDYNVNKTFEAYFESNGHRIHDFKGGVATVSMKFEPTQGSNTKNYKIYYLDDNAKMHKYATKYKDGMLVFATTHFSDYVIVYDGKVDVLLSQAKLAKGKIELSWNGLDNITKYVVYGAKCGHKYKKLKTTTGKSYTVKKVSGKKLKAHETYKFYVVAYDAVGNKVQSKSIHYVYKNTQGKYANVKSIKAKKTKLTLSVGNSKTIGATYKMYSGKKHIKKSHGVALRYTSTNPEVAKVSSSGKVTAVGKGTATIYIQDIGGKYCKTKVTVE